jgi:hypothetical protein
VNHREACRSRLVLGGGRWMAVDGELLTEEATAGEVGLPATGRSIRAPT